MIDDIRLYIFIYTNYDTIKSLVCVDYQYNYLLSQKHAWLLYYQNQGLIIPHENYVTSYDWIKMLYQTSLTKRYISILDNDNYFMLTYDDNQCLNFINQFLDSQLKNMLHLWIEKKDGEDYELEISSPDGLHSYIINQQKLHELLYQFVKYHVQIEFDHYPQLQPCK
jgi:hypothetical protein